MITCKDYAKQRKQELTNEIMELCKEYPSSMPPTLAIVQVGDDFASSKYTSFKINDCKEVGIHPLYIHLSKETTTDGLCACIADLILVADGIIVQLPLPSHIHFDKNMIPANRDVDGFRVDSLYQPCTPLGVMNILKANEIPLDGTNVVIIGRGELVGKPLINMMLKDNATVTVCHSHTKNLKEHCLQADIIVSAVGKPNVVTADMVKDNAVVIDVGVSRNADGKPIGDCDYPALKDKCSFITPWTGGAGVMTRLSLLENTVDAFKRRINFKEEYANDLLR